VDGNNIQRLRDEGGFVIKTPLPEQYARVLEDLDDSQITLLIEIKQRLDEAAESGTDPEVAHYLAYLLMPPF